MSIFTCCEREDETKYLHTCACPSATFSCESEEVSATLCGWPINPYGTPATPPNRYTTLTISGSGVFKDNAQCSDYGADPRIIDEPYVRTQISQSGSVTYNAIAPAVDGAKAFCRGGMTGSDSVTNNGVGAVTITTIQRFGAGGGNCPPSISSSVTQDVIWGSYVDSLSASWGGLCDSSPTPTTGTYCRLSANDPGGGDTDTRYIESSLSSPDTEAAAELRETPESGTSCSSTWQTRSTGFSWVKRTSEYTIECDDLTVGVEYEVKPAIRRRTVVIGSFGVWEDVTVTPVTFTATATTETIDQSGSPIALDHIQGYEYEITGVNIEKTA